MVIIFNFDIYRKGFLLPSPRKKEISICTYDTFRFILVTFLWTRARILEGEGGWRPFEMPALTEDACNRKLSVLKMKATLTTYNLVHSNENDTSNFLL